MNCLGVNKWFFKQALYNIYFDPFSLKLHEIKIKISSQNLFPG